MKASRSRSKSKGPIIGKHEAGAGLVDALMALALLAVGMPALVYMLNNLSQSRRAIELKAEATLLKKNLLSSTDCRALSTCQSDELRALKDYDGQILVDANGQSKFGAWTVRARCQPDQSLEIRAALINAKGEAVRDPLRGKLLDWQAPEGILIEAGILCGIVNKEPLQAAFSVQMSEPCTADQGTCPPPPESLNNPNAPGKMCCEDGRDAIKPGCPGTTQEFAAYWDRQDDWGASGQWVVLCQ